MCVVVLFIIRYSQKRRESQRLASHWSILAPAVRACDVTNRRNRQGWESPPSRTPPILNTDNDGP